MSIFGSKYMALKIGAGFLEGLYYNLQILSIIFDGFVNVKIDSMLVIYNISMPEYVAK